MSTSIPEGRPMRRPRNLLLFALAFAAWAGAATPQRCDLVSQAGQGRCLDLAGLNGSTIQVPANTTRIPSDGLSLCGIGGSAPPPTDIVYLVDNSNSMASWGFWVDPASNDTSWFIPDCQSAKIPGAMKAFRKRHFGATTGADSLQWDSLFQMTGTTNPGIVDPKNCLEANDPYSMRAEAVRVAMGYQATFDPGAMAGVIFFNKAVKQTFPMTVLDAQGLQTLRAGTGLYTSAGGTLWQPQLDSALTWLSATPSGDRSKAVILVSDGEPTDESKYKALLGKAGQPPVYAVYLGKTSDATPQLDYVTSVSGGKKFVVPPAEPDSLATVLQQILGTLIKPAKPDTLRVTNLTNGQTSVAKTSVADGNAYQMQLDSIVGLNPGSNFLQLTIFEASKTISATWTVVVADGAGTPGALDTLLTQRCGAPSSLALAPDNSGLSYAIDSSDRNILAVLNATPDLNSVLPVTISTRVSLDRETLVLQVPSSSAPAAPGTFKGSIPWQALTAAGAAPGDLVVRSGPGWDTLVARYQMPRDARDTASAILALRRSVEPALSMTPSVDGPSGQVAVSVYDDNTPASTISVTVRHRSGDSLEVTLVRISGSNFQGSFTFAQGTTKNLGDTILELGPLGAGLDSLSGSYLTSSAATLVRPAAFHLRFLDAQGAAHDTLGFDLPLGQSAPVTVQVWSGSSPCPTCAGLVSIVPSDTGLRILSLQGSPTGSIPLAGGQISILVLGSSPVRAGSIVFSVDSLSTSVTARPIRVSPPPPYLVLTVPHAVVRPGNSTPAGEAPISVMALEGTSVSDSSSWLTVEGPVLSKIDRDTRIGGVVAHLNRIPETLGLYIYDNLGVMVLHKDLSDLGVLASQGKIPQTQQGDYLLWLGWNGLDQGGKPVSTGVYVVRIYGWVKEGNQLLLLNEIKRTGFYRDLTANR
jgi:hypothetical protein